MVVLVSPGSLGAALSIPLGCLGYHDFQRRSTQGQMQQKQAAALGRVRRVVRYFGADPSRVPAQFVTRIDQMH